MRSLLSLALLFTLAACNQNGTGSATNNVNLIKIGCAVPLTGPLSHMGQDVQAGINIALEQANTQNIVLDGKPAQFELRCEDDQGEPHLATQAAQRLVDTHVAAVISNLTSGTTIPTSKIYADAGIPQITPASTNPEFTKQGYHTAFRIIPDDTLQGRVLASFAVNHLHRSRIAIIDDRTAYGQGLADRFADAALALGATVIQRAYIDTHSSDFNAQLTLIKASAPDLIFFGGMDVQAAPLVKQAQHLDMHTPFLGGDGMESAQFIHSAGNAAEGHYASITGAPLEHRPGYAEFSSILKQKYNISSPMYSPFAYDAAHVLIAAMQKARSAKPENYLPALTQTHYRGITGEIRFDAYGNRLSPIVTIYQVQNGEWIVAAEERTANGTPS